MSIITRVRESRLHMVYNWHSDGGRGRLCMLLSSVAASVAGNMSGGLFYNGYLLEHGFDYTSISVLTIIPYITTLLYLFSPALLERFPKRKGILVAAKVTSYMISIVGITLLPYLFEKDAAGHVIDIGGMRTAFIILIVTANTINALFSSGFSAWHANFLPNEIRADYFTSSSCISSLVTYGTIFGLSLLTDAVKDTAAYLPTLTIMRFVAFGIALFDVLFVALPKEYEYTKTEERPKFTNVFTLPVKNKKFLLGVLLLGGVTFATNIQAGYLDTYILDTIKIPYSLTNGINAFYFAFFLFFGSMWKKFIAKKTWFKALGYACLFEAPSYLLYSFIAPGRVALYITVRLCQHVTGVLRGTIQSAGVYVNLPEADRTNYFSFYTIVINGIAFLSRFVGIIIYQNVPDFSFLGINGTVPLLLLTCSLLEFAAAIPCFVLFRKVTPQNLLDEYDARRAEKKNRKIKSQ